MKGQQLQKAMLNRPREGLHDELLSSPSRPPSPKPKLHALFQSPPRTLICFTRTDSLVKHYTVKPEAIPEPCNCHTLLYTPKH